MHLALRLASLASLAPALVLRLGSKLKLVSDRCKQARSVEEATIPTSTLSFRTQERWLESQWRVIQNELGNKVSAAQGFCFFLGGYPWLLLNILRDSPGSVHDKAEEQKGMVWSHGRILP
jgi:hypothetical protein